MPITRYRTATGFAPETRTTADAVEAVQDMVGAMVIDSSSIDATYDDGAGTLSLAVITEAIQDIVGAFATDGTNIDVVYNDASNTLTFNITGTLAKGNLPSAIAYEDEANTFASLQTFSAGVAIAGGSNSTARIWRDATNGVTVRGFAGTTNCLHLINDGNQAVLTIANGSTAVVLAGPLTIGTNLTLVSPTTGTTVGAAGGASALPATPTGYLSVTLAGVVRKIPYYAS